MKILWVKSDFLHPTTRGGQIRTLEMLKRLHRRHEIHYVAFDVAEQSEGVVRSPEYCTRAYPIPRRIAPHASPAFWAEAARNAFSNLPLSVARYRSQAMQRRIAELSGSASFDAVVCDFLFPAQNIPDLSRVVLFQHNVEAQIWKRRAQHTAPAPLRFYIRGQHRKMWRYEREVCRAVRRIVAVSDQDAEMMRREYGAGDVRPVPTGVDVDFFSRPPDFDGGPSLLFAGSMDWMPNADGVHWFVSEVLPRIRKRLPGCTLTLAGRRPGRSVRSLAAKDPAIRVTGTVPDIRPYLWESSVAIVPLRIGGGTRLKIFEAMAAALSVVSTTVGAEGLNLRDGENICIADTPEDFADRCLKLLRDRDARRRIAAAARELVASRYSWEAVSESFEQLLF
ncbi:MAG TPA: glycosyltransferase [Bryobacteraceae bacterium]|nr:glycosyltransferase [Bryobacteraceae bacterium]